MMRQRRASVIVVLSLLASAATASAECAWVVWRQTLSDNPAVPKSGNWIPEGAFPTKEECVRDIDRKHAAYFGEAKLEGHTYTRGAYCLPDTWTLEDRRESDLLQRPAWPYRPLGHLTHVPGDRDGLVVRVACCSDAGSRPRMPSSICAAPRL